MNWNIQACWGQIAPLWNRVIEDHFLRNPRNMEIQQPISLGRACLVIVLVWAWLYLPFLSITDFRKEEGRRSQVAREMLERDDWVLPTFHGKPYLNKPPGFYWAVMAFAGTPKAVNEWTARLPSTLATLVCALFVALAARGMGGSPLLGGVTFLVTPIPWAKGRIAEIDALLGALVFPVIFCFWKSLSRPGSWMWPLLGGVALSCAVLTKGPVGFLFFYFASLGFLAWERKLGWLLSWRHLLFICVGLVGPGIWLWFLSQEFPLGDAVKCWAHEVGPARGYPDWLEALKSFSVYPLKAFFGLLPGSAILIWQWSRGDRSMEERSLLRMVTAATVPAVLFFWIHGRHGRYVLPAASVLALSSAVALAPTMARFHLSRKQIGWLLAMLILVGAIRMTTRWMMSLDPHSRDFGVMVTGLLPEGETLYTRLGKSYMNSCFYISRKVQQIDDWKELPEGISTVIMHPNEIPSVSDNIKATLFEGSDAIRENVVIVRIEKTTGMRQPDLSDLSDEEQ